MGSYDADRFAGSTIPDFLDRVPARPEHRDVRQLTIEELAPAQRMRRRAGEKAEPLADRFRRELAEIEESIIILAGAATRRQRQLAHLERYPAEDPFADGTRLEFTKVYPGSDQPYTYLALRAGGRWHLTGQRSPQNVGWVAFVEFMGLGVDEVWKIGPRGGRKKVIG